MTTATSVTVRRATEDDVAAITRIYNEGIVDRIATLEVEERPEEERSAWLRNRDERHPVFVAERDGVVVGWAALNVYNPRPAYRFVSDFSVYVGREARGAGVGKLLLARLIEEARARGFHKLVSAAFPFNTTAMRLYRNAGFREVGTFREQGVLDGRWVDTVVIELLLDSEPPPRGR
jgi:phosphinothricin acetyltransferase